MKKKVTQYIMQHGTVIFSSEDDITVPMFWNNITGKNFEKNETKQYEQYLEMMKLTTNLPSGYIQLFLKPGVMAEEFCVPSSHNLDTFKKETENQGNKIIFREATKFSDIFTQNEKNEHYHGKDNLTPDALDAARSWHCAQWGHTYYFKKCREENGFSTFFIKANNIIASSIFAIIETSSIPFSSEEEFVFSGTEAKESNKSEPESELLTAKKVFSMCKILNNVLVLPDVQLDRKVYADVKSIIEKNGGRWKGGKTQGFQFNFDPTDLFNKLHSGEDVNNKKDFQFFATQEPEINLMITKANIQPNDDVLEPSAGQGAIVDRILPLCKKVDMCEFMPENCQILKQKGYDILFDNFLDLSVEYKYDKILANPPFTKGQDIIHVRKMYEHLKPNGRIVTIMSTSWILGTQKKQVEFKKWLNDIGATYEEITEGAFKKSGTGVKTVMVTIDKVKFVTPV